MAERAYPEVVPSADARTESVAATKAPRAIGAREIVAAPPSAPPANHGHTLAAWFAMIAVILGVGIAGLGVALAAVALVIAGALVVVVGLLGGGVLRAMGFGQKAIHP